MSSLRQPPAQVPFPGNLGGQPGKSVCLSVMRRGEMSRTIERSYQDPLDDIWLSCAERLGLTVERSGATYASTPGDGRLILSSSAGMDPDDCLAQMILHEICHSLVMGTESFTWVDWGLDNEGTRDEELEHACLRLQAALLEPLGLRTVLGPTTDFREFYDALPVDPFLERSPSERASVLRARAALARRTRRPWGPHLEQALEATSKIVEAAHPLAQKHSLSAAFTKRAPVHRSGIPLHPAPGYRCGECAWSYQSGISRPIYKCRQAQGKRVYLADAACERFEPTFGCLGCGACCREAYDTVEVDENDPAKKRHLKLMVERTGGHDMARLGSRCIALRGGEQLEAHVPAIQSQAQTGPEHPERRSPPHILPNDVPFTCAIYDDRPRTCRDFTLGSDNCLDARRTVGLSR